MDLDSKIEVTIGPYEVTFFLLAKKKKYEVTSLFNPQQQLLNLQVYEDTLAAQKAAFESFVTITDPVESEKLSLYKSLLPEMEQVTLSLSNNL